MKACRQHRFRLAGATLAVAALSAPVGAAAANEGNALLRNDRAHFGSETAPATADTRSTPAPAVVVRVDEGFDWVSAGVGAAGGFGALLLAAGAASAFRRRTDTAVAGGR
jgi:hypothetical protein